MTSAEEAGQIARLERRLARERKARADAEAIAERVTGELYGAMQELGMLHDALRDFVAIVAHDLRGPLTVVLGSARLVLTKFLEPEDASRGLLEAIARSAVEMDRLVHDLLTMSQLEAGELATRPQEVSLKEAVEVAIASLGEQAAQFTRHIAEDAIVTADADHVRRILTNYLSNALRYGQPPFEITPTRVNEAIELRVCDTGDGVPDAQLPRLFVRFARGDSATAVAEGTGLGLSIVRGLARVNHGEAWHEPNTPRGSRFCFRLPIHPVDVGLSDDHGVRA